ncbi:MAG: NADH-quinone oxidoreductase subunit M [Acidimicrobiales bacterium]
MEHSTAASFDVLSTIVALPALGAIAIGFVSRRRPEVSKQLAVLATVLTGALSVWLLIDFDTDQAGFQFVERYQWIENLGISWHVGVDGISLFMVVLTGVLFPIAILGADPHHDHKPYYAWLLLLEAGCMGAFVSLDLFLFFLMFEVVLVPMYFLIGGWGYGDRAYVAVKFFLFTMFGGAFMLVSIIALAVLHQRGVGGDLTFDLVEIASNPGVAQETARWIFLGFAVAFAVKVPLFPVHTWLPDAHTEAPTAGSVILAGVMLKLGTYGFLRFGVFLFPEATRYFAPLFLTLGVIGIIYGAIVAGMQRDLKRIVAYSSVAHLGFIALGTFAMTTQSLEGAVLQAVNHGISTPALFLLVGFIYERRHTREIAALKGLQKAAPILAAVFTLVMLSSIGVPGLNGFAGEFLILVGSFLTARWWTVVAAAGVIVAAFYLLWAYQRVFHGTPDDDNESIRDLSLAEGLVMAPLLGLIVFLGIYPKPALDRIAPSVSALIDHVEEQTDYVEPVVAEQGHEVVAVEHDEEGE